MPADAGVHRAGTGTRCSLRAWTEEGPAFSASGTDVAGKAAVEVGRRGAPGGIRRAAAWLEVGGVSCGGAAFAPVRSLACCISSALLRSRSSSNSRICSLAGRRGGAS
jgi:hypothetical protein